MAMYEELMDKNVMLECLLSSGVDSWEGYEKAMELFYASFNSEY